jgi:hypothetical protein
VEFKSEKLAKYITGMSRGVVVLDENLAGLESYLRDENIRVIIPESGLEDDKIKYQLLPHRILITNNSKDFIDDATSIEYGIIATENIKFKDQKKFVKLISKAIIKFNLWAEGSGFLLVLHEDGKHEFNILPA